MTFVSNAHLSAGEAALAAQGERGSFSRPSKWQGAWGHPSHLGMFQTLFLTMSPCRLPGFLPPSLTQKGTHESDSIFSLTCSSGRDCSGCRQRDDDDDDDGTVADIS